MWRSTSGTNRLKTSNINNWSVDFPKVLTYSSCFCVNLNPSLSIPPTPPFFNSPLADPLDSKYNSLYGFDFEGLILTLKNQTKL